MTQTNSTKINHLTQLCVVHADFDIWSGQVRLTADDLKLGAGERSHLKKLPNWVLRRSAIPHS
jgi:hypothetical protein